MNRKKPSFAEMESMLKTLAERDRIAMDRDMAQRLREVIREEQRNEFRRQNYRRLAQCAAAIIALLAVLVLLPLRDSAPASQGGGMAGATPDAAAQARELQLELLQEADSQSFYPEANATYDTGLNMRCGFAQSGAYDIEAYPVTL